MHPSGISPVIDIFNEMIDTYISNVNYTIFLYRNTSKSKYKNRL